MTYEKDKPFAIVDEESNPPVVIARYARLEQAEFHIGHLAATGGKYLRDKVERGGYGIDGPEEQGKETA